MLDRCLAMISGWVVGATHQGRKHRERKIFGGIVMSLVWTC